MNDNNAVAEDFAAFNAPPPEVQAEMKKQAAAAAKAKKPANTTAKDTKIVDAALERAREEKEVEEKARLLTLISDYLRHFKEYFPDRVEFLKVPKNVSAKNSLQELRIYVKDLENELGKRGAFDIVKKLHVNAADLFEQANEGKRFGLNMENLGLVARHSLAPRPQPDGSVLPGTAIPTLHEMSIKYASMFSSRVEFRYIMMVTEMIVAVHRANEAGGSISRAAQAEVSEETAELMKQI